MKRILPGVLMFLSASLLLLAPERSAEAISHGLQVCAGSILPVMFPFFVWSELWIQMGFSKTICRFLGPVIEKLFHLPQESASALILGAIGGYPAGAQVTTKLYDSGRLTKTEAEATLLFCNNAGPAFIIGVLGGALFQSTAIGLALWAIHLLAAWIPGFLFRPKKIPSKTVSFSGEDKRSFISALTEAIDHAGQTTFHVCVFILIFSILFQQLQALLPKSVFTTVLLGSLELAGGCSRLGTLGLTQETAFVICAGLLGWGGLCVHCQTVSLLSQTDLCTRTHWLGKTLHALCSIALACLVSPFLPLRLPCFTSASRPPTEAICLLASMVILVFLKSSSGKTTHHRI